MEMFESRSEADVVPTLVAKRAELANLITETERVLTQLHADLVHLDGAIKLFYPDAGGTIPSPPASVRQAVFQPGELPYLVLEVLRRATHPLDTVEIARRVVIARSLDAGDAGLLATTAVRVGKVLSRLRSRKKAVGTRTCGRLRWTAG
ncbi:hypothetical protein N825_20725 [Skermanella stibiiresistens SB22]|uniref:Uncharacterized protein n=1 Tax=Skermanella stibiiresistens SB22 TaxID=1385369 RepID=W9GU12_9PROT|nr:hypothetical protein [Skermanella stibiiresistens]EWY37269.1 hypothetical protein N825_20725 [Skermanella stibiiresistens SB22]